jgi:hypothetical protein
MIDRPFHKGDREMELMLYQSIRNLPPGWYDVKFDPKQMATTAQRGYFHGKVMQLYAEYIGECERGAPWPDDEAWERCKKQFRPRQYPDPVTGEIQVVGRSTKGMTPREFFEFADEVIQWLEGQGVPVPAPDKNWREARQKAMQQEQRSVA